MLPPAFLFSLGSWLSFWTWPLAAPTAAHRPSISDSQLRVKAPQGMWEVWVLHAVMCTVRSYASTPPSRPCLFSQLHFYTSVSVHVLCDWHEGPSGASFISILRSSGISGEVTGYLYTWDAWGFDIRRMHPSESQEYELFASAYVWPTSFPSCPLK